LLLLVLLCVGETSALDGSLALSALGTTTSPAEEHPDGVLQAVDSSFET
jgi:hypothetical protein